MPMFAKVKLLLPPYSYHADYENGTGKSNGKLAGQVMESLSSATKKKIEIRYEEGYDVKDDELYVTVSAKTSLVRTKI